MTVPDPRDRLMLALDIIPENPVDLLDLIDSLEDTVRIVKVGWPLIMRWGLPDALRQLVRKKRVFLDAKFTDLGAWAKDLVRQCEDIGVEFITINHGWATVEAAVKGRSAGSSLKIFTLTLLTSIDQDELRAQGITKSVHQMVIDRALEAQKIGCDGVIASGKEAAAIREETGDDFLIVTPGIRLAGASVDDHRRVATPTAAIKAGANYLVVGRPIMESPDKRKAALDILAEMKSAFEAKAAEK